MKIQDIQTADSALWRQFSNYYSTRQYAAALALLENAQLENKAMNAELINGIINAVDSAQDLYYADFEDVLAADLDKFNGDVEELGNMGVYSSTATYYQGNFVTDGNDTYMYISTTPSAGIALSNTSYWLNLGLKGDKGAPSIGLNLKYNWDMGIQYYTDDVVYYSGAFYYAKQDNANSTPSPTSADWGVLLSIGQAQIYTSTTEPSVYPYVGLMWGELEVAT